MFERFTERARQVVVRAQEEARGLRHNYIGTEHVLLGLLGDQDGVAVRALESLGITLNRAREEVVRIVGLGEEAAEGMVPFTPRAKKILELSLREALSLGYNYIGSEHILLGLACENEGVAARILLDLDADAQTIRDTVIEMLPVASEPGAAGSMTVAAPRATTVSRVVDRAWVGDLDRVLDQLAGEIRRDLRRAPDTGDLLVAFLGAPDTLAGRVLRELGAELGELPGIVERVRTGMLADDVLARQIQELARARERTAEDLARLRADERKLREQAEARTALTPEALRMIRQHLGLPAMSSENPPKPPLLP